MKISFIIPSRNNLKYLEWAYNSIRKNQGEHKVEICVADDFSEDDTKKWCEKTAKADEQFKWIRNEGPKRQGLVILNDTLVNEVATNDLCMIYHADMYLCPGALDAIEKHLKEKTIVSLTRIEPPLHPPGPEKILKDYGIEPEEFKEYLLLNNLGSSDFMGPGLNTTTEGIFAPWAFWKKDFQEIGGHDILFAPQSKEDSDIFNRFYLNGVKFIQTWEGFVYHMTSRGSRFNPYSGGAPGQNSKEWLNTTTKNMRNFIRKWGHAVKHDPYMKPIVPPKYLIGIKVKNCTLQLLEALEPWCQHIYMDLNIEEAATWISEEQMKTSFNMIERVHNLNCIHTDNDRYDHDNIIIDIDGTQFTNQDFQTIQQLPEIIQDSGEIGQFELGNITININNLETYENDLITNNKQ